MKIKIPYTLTLLLPIAGWGFLCAAFAYILVLIMAVFKEVGAKGAFSAVVPIYVFLILILAVIKYSGIGSLGTQDVKIINRNITKKGLNYNLPTEEVEKTFYALTSLCRDTSFSSLAAGMAVLSLVFVTVSLNGISDSDVFIISVVGFVTCFFMAAFATFFCEQSIFPMLKECRRVLMERNEKFEEIKFSSIDSKFYFFLLLPFATIFILLACVFPVDFKVIILSLIGLMMTFIISKMLFSSMYNSLMEIDNFSSELPKGDRAIFATGSLNKEFVEMAENLNQASEKIYTSRKELEESKKELEKQLLELEKFFNLTVNRELKMIELKRQLKGLKND